MDSIETLASSSSPGSIKETHQLHVVVVYSWANRQNAEILFKYLFKLKPFHITAYSDRNAQHDSSFPQDVVDISDVVVLICDEKLKASQHCQQVADYAYQRKKIIYPIIFEKGFVVEGWLENLFGYSSVEDLIKHLHAVEFEDNEETFGKVANNFLYFLAKLIAENSEDVRFHEIALAINKMLASADKSRLKVSMRRVDTPDRGGQNSRALDPDANPLAITENGRFRKIKIFLNYTEAMSRYSKRFRILERFFEGIGSRFELSTSENSENAELTMKTSDIVISMHEDPDFAELEVPRVIYVIFEDPSVKRKKIRSFYCREIVWGIRPLPSVIDEISWQIIGILTSTFNIPRPCSGIYIEKSIKVAELEAKIKKLCSGSSEEILLIQGESGIGKTTLLSKMFDDFYNKRYLFVDCNISNVVWFDADYVNAETEDQIFDKLGKAFEIPNDVEIYSKTRINLASMFSSEKRSFGYLVIIVDNFPCNSNGGQLIETLMKMGSLVKLILITPDSVSENLVGNSGKVILAKDHSLVMELEVWRNAEIERYLSRKMEWSLDRSALRMLADLCLGSPLIAQLISGKMNATIRESFKLVGKSASTGLPVLVAESCEHIGERLIAEQKQFEDRFKKLQKTCNFMFHLLMDRNLHDEVGEKTSLLAAYSHFLAFSHGEPISFTDLAVMINSEVRGAENLCSAFEHRGLVRPSHKTREIVTSYAMNKLVYHSAGLECFGQLKNPSAVRNRVLENAVSSKDVVYFAVKKRCGQLLRRIILGISHRSLIKICNFTYEIGNVEEKSYGQTFTQVLLNENWRLYEGTIYECDEALGILNLILDNLEGEGRNLLDPFQALTVTNANNGECTLLQILETDWTNAGNEGRKLKEKVDQMMLNSANQLTKEMLSEKRRWIAEAKIKTNPPLHFPALIGEEVLVLSLINNGADINKTNYRGETALMVAAANGQRWLCHTLIEKGANINLISNNGMTAFLYAVMNGHLEVVMMFLSTLGSAIDVNLAEKRVGMTALMFAARSGFLDIIFALVGHPNLHVNNRSINGSTAVMMAAQKGQLKAVESLISAGADVDLANVDEMTALMLAAENGHADVVKVLVSLGCDVEGREISGMTPLMLAAKGGHDSVTIFLRVNGAILSKSEHRFDRTAVMLAAKYGHLKVLESLRFVGDSAYVNNTDSSRRKLTALIMAAENGHGSVVQYLVTLGADVNMRDASTGHSALSIAVRKGYWEIAEFLIVHGAEVNSASSDENGETPLVIAAKSGNEQCVETLVKHKADINFRDKKRQLNALMHAFERGYFSISRYLLDCGVELTDNELLTVSRSLLFNFKLDGQSIQSVISDE